MRCDACRGGPICDACFEIAWEICLANRRRFQQLRAAGVSERMANDILIARGSGEAPS